MMFMSNESSILQDPHHDQSTITESEHQFHTQENSVKQKTDQITTQELSQNLIKTHDQKLAHADAFRAAKKNLQNSLKFIHEKSLSSSSGYHWGQLSCQSCAAKNQMILNAYKEYFLAPEPSAWYAELSEYRDEMNARFQDIKSPTKQDLKDLHAISRKMLRKYILNYVRDLNLSNDTEISNAISSDMAQEISVEQLIQKIYDLSEPYFPNPDAKKLIMDLQATDTSAERASLYIKYYCMILPDDASQQKNFKAKYARMFENQVSHDEVLTAMRKEAHHLNSQKLNALHKELSELQLAQSAHLKNKARKAEKDQRIQNRELSPEPVHCNLKRCAIKLNPKEENLECALCDWLNTKGSGKGRFFYCTAEHAKEDFDNHDRNEHQCAAGDRCLYYPQAGSPGDTSASGICASCVQSREGTYYFCSEDCYRHNIDWHANRYHIFDYQREDTNVLEYFRPLDNMKIIP
ncbi:hypothetical protein GcC1_136003 [Golovinomyces cichoracearum]|uniref:Uncharacterized protein n=1 Tax=Golovinomyces cichoracearum TaxID=62708 RepID=A0A420I2G7_9PEZI|nr:hypothetical protein GcC1_136003 [Golovinomyces cichoracearum]